MSTMHHITVGEFDRMIGNGVFDATVNQRIELIAGALRDMNPPRPMHDEVVDRVRDWADEWKGTLGYRVRTEKPISLAALDSVPYPDVTLVRHRSYARRRPQPEDIFLIVEVADTTLATDRNEKAKLYAAAGLQDYWIVNIPQRCVEVFREPNGDDYRSAIAVELSGEVRPLAFPTIGLSVAKLFESWDDE
jgi:Uma2 family endonuclease